MNLQYSQIGPFFGVTIIGLIIARLIIKKIDFVKFKVYQLIYLYLLCNFFFLCLSFSNKIVICAISLFLYIGMSSIIVAISTYWFQTLLVNKIRPKILSLKYSISKFIFILVTPFAGFISDKFGYINTIRWVFFFYCLILIILYFITLIRRKSYEYC